MMLFPPMPFWLAHPHVCCTGGTRVGPNYSEIVSAPKSCVARLRRVCFGRLPWSLGASLHRSLPVRSANQ